MTDAVVVSNVYKKFSESGQPFWSRVLKQDSNGNGKGKNGSDGHGKITVAVDRVSFAVHEGKIFGVLGPNDGDRIAVMASGKVVALNTPARLKKSVTWKDGKEPTLEDVFLEMTGKKLAVEEEAQ